MDLKYELIWGVEASHKVYIPLIMSTRRQVFLKNGLFFSVMLWNVTNQTIKYKQPLKNKLVSRTEIKLIVFLGHKEKARHWNFSSKLVSINGFDEKGQ